MATAYTPLASNPPVGTEEWPAGTPVAGFRNLFRLSLVSLLLGIPSLACQIYLVLTISATGEDGWVDSPANSVWASVVCLLASGHMIWVSTEGKKGRPGIKGHLGVAIATSFIASVTLFVGLGFNAMTAGNLALTQGTSPLCTYFNSTFTSTQAPPVTEPGMCRSCAVSYFWGDGVARRACCCCLQNGFSYADSITFYGVDSCEVALDTVYPNALVSALLYGAIIFLTFLSAVVGCIVACQCFCCSKNCGPFPDRRPRMHHPNATYMNIGQPPPQQYYTAVPVVAGTATAPGGYGATAPAPASYSAAFPPQHGMAPSQPQAGYASAPSAPPAYDAGQHGKGGNM